MFPRLPARETRCCGHKICVQERKNVSDICQKHFVSATNVFWFRGMDIKHVSSFVTALR